MKHIVTALAVLLLLQSCTQKKKDIIFATHSTTELKKDLWVLRNLIEKVHAGSFAYNDRASYDKLFDSIDNSINKPLTKIEFFDKLSFILDNIHCTHTDCYFPADYYDTLKRRKYFFPIPLIKIGEKIYVNTEAYNIPSGSELISIDNHSAANIINKLFYHTHADAFSRNYKDDAINTDFAYDYFLEFGTADPFNLKFRNAETKEVENINVHPETLENIYNTLEDDIYYSFPTDISYDLKLMEDKKAALLTITTFDMPSYSQATAFTHFLQNSFALMRLKSTKNLIIDFRNNGGGYFRHAYALLSYFINSPLKQFDSAIRRFNRLPYKDYVAVNDSANKIQIDTSWKDYLAGGNDHYVMKAGEIDTCFPAKNHFNGKVYIITNSNVLSAAASSVALFKEKVGAIVVGEETGGGYRAFNSKLILYTLPHSGIRINIPTIRYYVPVTSRENSNGVKPNYYRPLTIPDFTGNYDGPLVFILDSLIH